MALRSLSWLKTRVRQMSDMENSTFISDLELASIINDSVKKLYDILVASNEDYNTLITTISITSGNTTALPANYYKVRGVDAKVSGEWTSIKRFQFQERSNYKWQRTYRPVTYRLVSNDLHILPEDEAIGDYRIWYVPEQVDLVDDLDTIDGKNGFEEYVILDAAIKCRIKEESDTRELEQAKNEALSRVTAMAQERDYGGADRIADVTSRIGEIFYDD
jgi:hypothetical protein